MLGDDYRLELIVKLITHDYLCSTGRPIHPLTIDDPAINTMRKIGNRQNDKA